MLRSYSARLQLGWRGLLRRRPLDRPTQVRIALGILLGLNLLLVWFVFHPPGGSFEDLESRIVTTRQQIVARQQAILRLARAQDKTETARSAGDAFLSQYFLPRQHAYSQIEIDLAQAAKSGGIRAKDRTFNYEQVEGSDTLGMLTVSANFEGTYADLIQFVNQVDRAPRLLILESLTAQPVQGSPTLAISMKLDAFFRFEDAGPPPPPAAPEGGRP